MKCHKCDFDKGQEYFEVPLDSQEGTANLCAKCYAEAHLRSPPYFRGNLSTFQAKVPLREHYESASLFRFLENYKHAISRIIEDQHKGRAPTSIEVNFKKIESRLVYLDDQRVEEVQNTHLTKLVLLWKETHHSLDLSVHLAMNRHDRSAVTELRFVFEKWVDFAYLLLPSLEPIRATKEISFSDWVSGKKIKARMNRRCELLASNLTYEPYELYGRLCQASHGLMTFLSTTDYVFSQFENLPFYFKYLRWFCLFLWTTELIENINSLFVTEFGIANSELTALQTLLFDLLSKYPEDLKAVKENKFFLMEFPDYKAQYWTNFESAVLHTCDNDIPADKHKKLTNDYIFWCSLANYPPDVNISKDDSCGETK